MARIQTFLPFDQTTVNFNAIYSYGSSSFYNNSYLTLDGQTYEDAAIATYDIGDYVYMNVIAGRGLQVDSWNDVVSGTITGLFQGVGLDSDNMYDQVYVTGLSLSGAEYYRAISTYSTDDDQAMIRRAFAGNDRFDLGNYQDHAQGHGGNDLMYGNGGNDTLEGGAGNDAMIGGSGNDRILGNSGNDRIWGGAGIDRQAGGTGSDVFIFRSTAELGRSSTTTDVIADFTHGVDRIDLSGIDAMTGASGNQAFTFIGSNAIGTSSRGEISVQLYDRPGTADDMTLVRIDTDSDRDAEAVIRLTGLHTLSASDFIL